jgi:large subunit ribosomal protein L2
MPKYFKPTTPGQRKLVQPVLLELDPAEKTPKSLCSSKRRINGRNHSGHITCRHKGGGHKKKFRAIDFLRDKEGIDAIVAGVEYDPNRSALIALLHYADGEKRFIIAPQGIKKGDVVSTSNEPPYKIGCCMRLKFMPIGSVIHNIELVPGRGAKLVRSAGLSAQLQARSTGYATIRMPSGEVRMIHEDCKATFGAVSNSEHNLRVIGKAGRKRWMGVRPTVRGVHMNPVDHPHGGGEGRGKGNHPQTPWGQFTKGFRTRSKKKSNKLLVKGRSR